MYLHKTLFLTDRFSDSLHNLSLSNNFQRKRNWGFLLNSRFACTTFFLQKEGFLVINLLPDFCTVCKKSRFVFSFSMLLLLQRPYPDCDIHFLPHSYIAVLYVQPFPKLPA